ncbi:MAG: hypothetical protein IK005_02735 [Paludibacteraceae bacterium]|nr:hypothetical protein [Paludibacteraceae bacterium]
MKIDIEFIKKADYILVFLCSLAGLIMLSFLLIDVFFKPSHKEVTVNNSINNENEDKNEGEKEGQKKEEKEHIEFYSLLNDGYLFKVKNYNLPLEYSRISKIKSYDEEEMEYGLSNFLFINSKKEEYRLFPSNSQYIYKYSFIYEKEDSLECNLYAVIKNDTNDDKKLTTSDDVSLYISDPDGKNLTEISPDIQSLEQFLSRKIVFTEYHDKELKYYAFDCKKREKIHIKSVKQDYSSKKLDLPYYKNSYRR